MIPELFPRVVWTGRVTVRQHEKVKSHVWFFRKPEKKILDSVQYRSRSAPFRKLVFLF